VIQGHKGRSAVLSTSQAITKNIIRAKWNTMITPGCTNGAVSRMLQVF
jgi:hypothetical protein